MSEYETIDVRQDGPVCFLQIDRPGANNTINEQLVEEMSRALSVREDTTSVVVVSGSAEVFCFGADFKALGGPPVPGAGGHDGPGPLYDLWLKLATGPYISVAHVRGKANAGGMGFVAASDIVLADETAQFSLSELLFGLYPACVLPFLVRKIGFQKAHYLTLMTQPITVAQASEWGLVDAFEVQSESLLRRHLLRLRRLSKTAIRRYKAYMGRVGQPLAELRGAAVAANVEVFSDTANLQGIARFVERGVFPWERA
jgi:polyketide biosynthesis enoyl-CoA hydratase PksH